MSQPLFHSMSRTVNVNILRVHFTLSSSSLTKINAKAQLRPRVRSGKMTNPRGSIAAGLPKKFIPKNFPYVITTCVSQGSAKSGVGIQECSYLIGSPRVLVLPVDLSQSDHFAFQYTCMPFHMPQDPQSVFLYPLKPPHTFRATVGLVSRR